jgi:hypothetical protein
VVVRSFTRYLEAHGVLGQEVMTPGEEVITAYRTYLEERQTLHAP